MIKKLENSKWRVLKRTPLLNCGPWLNVRKEEVQLPNGFVISEWFLMDFPDWINVIAITKAGEFVLIDQYRHALGETHYELVAGVVDKGESPLHAAQRELSEETGYEGGEWQAFMELSPNPTNHTNKSYTFLAMGVEKVREPHQEPSEDIHVHVLTRDELKQLLASGEIIQALHAAPLWKYFAGE